MKKIGNWIFVSGIVGFTIAIAISVLGRFLRSLGPSLSDVHLLLIAIGTMIIGLGLRHGED